MKFVTMLITGYLIGAAAAFIAWLITEWAYWACLAIGGKV